MPDRCADPDCDKNREAKMVTVRPGVSCDPCIAEIVGALNAAGLRTVASCCGHKHRPATISLQDGREIFILRSFEEARMVDRLFPVDINGRNLSHAG